MSSDSPDPMTDLRHQAETRLKEATKETSALSAEEAGRLIHELHTHEIELEIQNEQLRATQESLQESLHSYADLYDQAPVGYFTLDKHGLMARLNLTAAGMLGGERADLIQKPFGLFVADSHQDDLFKHRYDVSRSHKAQSVELQLKPAVGRPDWVRMDSLYIELSGAGSFEVRSTLTDITKQKASECELFETHRRLESAYAELKQSQEQLVRDERLRSMGEMASGIAHDFNNTLANILGYAELLLHRMDDLTSAKKDLFLKIIVESAHEGSQSVNRLRHFYQPRETTESVGITDLQGTIAAAIQNTRPRWEDLAGSTGVHYEIQTDLDISNTVKGNSGELVDMFNNLIFNSLDAMPAGGKITIKARSDAENDDAPATRILVEFSDNGPGMDAECRKRCLEPFFTTKGKKGSGLGLSIVYGIVARLGGTVDVVSSPGNGCTIQLGFPVATRESDNLEETASPAPIIPAKVLYVEDNANLRHLMTLRLKQDGHQITTASDGFEAVRIFEPGMFDIVITDRGMPGISGDEVASALRRVDAAIPIIMITGSGDMMRAANESPVDVDVVLPKPVSHGQIRECMAGLLKRRG